MCSSGTGHVLDTVSMTIVHQDFPSHLGIKIAQFIFLTTIIATVSDTLLWSIDITGQLKVCWNPIVDSGRNEKVTFFESVSTLDKLSDLSGPNGTQVQFFDTRRFSTPSEP